MKKHFLVLATLTLTAASFVSGTEDATQILTNHLGYETFSAKRAVVRTTSGQGFDSFVVKTYPGDVVVLLGQPGQPEPVAKWRDWRFATIDFSDLQAEGVYIIECIAGNKTLRSFPFRIQNNIIERHTLSDVIAYFKGQRCSGPLDKADRQMTFLDGRPSTLDLHGGWYDASGDYGKHLSHLSFSTFHNPQQAPLVIYSLLRTWELLEGRGDDNFTQFKKRLLDEATYGADFLVRMKNPNGSFFQSVSNRGPGKKPEDRRLTPASKGFKIKLVKPTDDDFRKQGKDADEEAADVYEVSYRGGGGMAIAALAMAARCPFGADFNTATYLKTAEEVFVFLQSHNLELTNDGKENIVDDYAALLAATELFRTTNKAVYGEAAKMRANRLLDRLIVNKPYRNYWRADDQDRPFFHAADAGLPLVSLLGYYSIADRDMQSRIVDAVRHSLEFELTVTGEVKNPFGLARQYVQNKAGLRKTTFFYPHDADTAPWWQGENARLGSLAAAARLAAPLFASDPILQKRLQEYAVNQLNWILGLNPFDACMLHGTGRNNPEYMFFSSYQYTNAPGGICNGITGGYADEDGIDFNLSYGVTGKDEDWRWGEQWLPHASWYLLAIAAGGRTTYSQGEKVVIAYLFPEDKLVKPADVAVEKLTHINYAFADIKDGRMVEGFKYDRENFQILNSLKKRNPKLKVMISVGGWTWSGGFSDMCLTTKSRTRFITSAVDFVLRHKLDGLDIDWEYPGLIGYGNKFREEDKQNFTALVAELRQAFDQAGAKTKQRYLLTIAAGAMDEFLDHTEMGKVQRNLDFVNLMTYDQCESEADAIAGHHAPLFTHPENPKGISAATMVDHFIQAGVPSSKIVLGVPFYGRSWGEVGPGQHGLYQPGKPPSEHVDTSFRNIKVYLENKNGFVRFWDDISRAPILYNAEKRLFITYEDERSLAEKCRYLIGKGLAGIMFWEYSEDPEGRLLDVINRELTIK